MTAPPVPQYRTSAAAKYLSQRGLTRSVSYLEKTRGRGPEDSRDRGPDFTRDEVGICWYDEVSLNRYLEQHLKNRKFRAPAAQPRQLRTKSA